MGAPPPQERVDLSIKILCCLCVMFNRSYVRKAGVKNICVNMRFICDSSVVKKMTPRCSLPTRKSIFRLFSFKPCLVPLLTLLGLLLNNSVGSVFAEEKQWQVYDGYQPEGYGRHIVFVSGDEEYRSEEALPMLAKIMAVRHGFKCTVLFAQDPENPGIVNPQVLNHIPGLEALRTADLIVIATRFRALPDQ